ncbi:MAG: VCBS repeat-containing protein [Anaerolineae bacterium]|nr:VCBS repeat-containing protein [Anaerolineae bacterium]
MKPQKFLEMILGLILLLGVVASGQWFAARAAPQLAVQTPVLKWQRGGCYASWCETGWYASPAVADLDNDGTMEVIGGAYTVFILNGEDGTVQQSVDTPGSRVWPGVVVADIDGDTDLEIVTAQGDGYLNVLNHTGSLVWTRQPSSSELRGLSVYDLDGDGTLEIIVTAAVGSKTNTWVYKHDGALRSGWPQLSDDSGYAWGVFNDNAAVGDLDGDGTGEIVIPSDVHYICAYEPDGSQIPAHSMYGGKGWGKVGVWESLTVELRGWGECNGVRAESYRTNFAHGPAVIADVNGDGALEVVATGNVYDCNVGHPPGKYNGVYVFNADRSRFNAGGYDWQTVPVDTGAPLTEDYNIIENNQPNPVTADLDGDGKLEILYSSYDGRVHVFWPDKTEHHAWPYAVYSGSRPYRFASEPVVADLDADGYAEVIFASWVEKGSNQTGKLHILNYQGTPLREVDLPLAFGSADWNGALAAPTLANIDSDADLEVVLNTAHAGFVAYDLPGTANAHILWGTGRGNYRRTGSILIGSLQASRKWAQPMLPGPGDVLTYTITLQNSGLNLPKVVVTDTLPGEVNYLHNLWASAGSYGESGGVITWTGAVSGGMPVTITYGVTVSEQITEPYVIANTVLMDDGLGNVLQRQAIVIANGIPAYLPVIQKN